MSADIDYFLFEQLKRHEGYRRYPYQDTVGKLTIGIGRNIHDVGISEEEAEYLLNNDLHNSARELGQRFGWFPLLSKKRRQAMINLHFNMGINSLMTFKKFLKAMQDENWQAAKDELLDSKYATQVGYRAEELADQILKG